MSPFRTRNAVKELLNRFANLYHPTWLAEHGPAVDIDDFVERVGLGREYTTRTGDEWALDAVGVGEKWMSEIMEGSTRVNVSSYAGHANGPDCHSTPLIWLTSTRSARQSQWPQAGLRQSRVATGRSSRD